MKVNAQVRFQTVVKILQISLKKLVVISKTPILSISLFSGGIPYDSKCD